MHISVGGATMNKQHVGVGAGVGLVVRAHAEQTNQQSQALRTAGQVNEHSITSI
jgi:hypothetical protein